MDGFEAVNEIAKACNGKITEVGILPDNSGFALMTMELPETHWIYGDKEAEGPHQFEAPPMVMKMGARDLLTLRLNETSIEQLDKRQMEKKIRAAGKYAVRSATMKGKEMDFDPDALLQNLVVGFLGYWTEDGLTDDEWANPPQFRRK